MQKISTPPALPVIEIARQLSPFPELQTNENGFVIVCPGHPGTIASGTICADPENPAGAPLVECWGSCTQEKIIRGLRAQKLWFWDTDPEPEKEAVHTTFYDRGEKGTEPYYYFDISENGEWYKAARVVKITQWTAEEKYLGVIDRPQRPKPDGRWIKAGNSFPWPIYNKKEVMQKAHSGSVVFNVNTEIECDLIEQLKLVAFCHQGGLANSKGFARARPERDLSFGKGVQYCVIIPNQDKENFKFAILKARHLNECGVRVKMLWLPGLLQAQAMPAKNGPGLIEWYQNHGGTRDLLVQLARNTDFWQPEETDVIEPLIEVEKSDQVVKLHDAELEEDSNPYSELSMALFFHRIYGSEAIYVPELGWLLWDGKRWQTDQSDSIKLMMARAVETRYQYFKRNANKFAPEDRDKWYKKFGDEAPLRHSVSLAKGRCKGSIADFDADPMLLNCRNCIIDLRTGDPIEHNRKYKLTRMVPWDYTGIENVDHPRWTKFLTEVFVKPEPVIGEDGRKRWVADWETIWCFNRAVGYSLTGLKKKMFFLLWGPPDAGKSVIGERLLLLGGKGEYSKSASKRVLLHMQQENKYSDFLNIAFSRIVVMDEIGSKDILDDEKVRSATGGDRVQVSKPHQAPYEAEIEAKIWVYGNEKPKVHGNGNDATWIRIVVFPFHRQFAKREQQDNLHEELDKEGSAILSWAVRGCLQYQSMQNQINASEEMLKVKKLYQHEMDELADFFDEFVLDGKECYADELFKLHYRYQSEMLRMKSPWTKTKFGLEIQKKGIKKRRDKDTGRTIYDGIHIDPIRQYNFSGGMKKEEDEL